MILFFDTETNDNVKDHRVSYKQHDNWPRMVELAYAVYDEKENCAFAHSTLVKPIRIPPVTMNSPDGSWEWTMSPGAQGVHGISLEACLERGCFIKEALDQFETHCVGITEFVAHNIDFDSNVIAAEYDRLGLHAPWVLDQTIQLYCTMKATTNFCRLAHKNAARRGFKWPKLEELHLALFGTKPETTHAALADVQTMAKCYFAFKRLNVPAAVTKNHLDGIVAFETLSSIEACGYMKLHEHLYTGVEKFVSGSTPKAIFIGREMFPKSQLALDKTGTLWITLWLARRRTESKGA